MPDIKFNPQLQSLYDCIVQKLIPDGLLTRIIPEPIPKSIMENTIPHLKKIIKRSSSPQEISEKYVFNIISKK